MSSIDWASCHFCTRVCAVPASQRTLMLILHKLQQQNNAVFFVMSCSEFVRYNEATGTSDQEETV